MRLNHSSSALVGAFTAVCLSGNTQRVNAMAFTVDRPSHWLSGSTAPLPRINQQSINQTVVSARPKQPGPLGSTGVIKVRRKVYRQIKMYVKKYVLRHCLNVAVHDFIS